MTPKDTGHTDAMLEWVRGMAMHGYYSRRVEDCYVLEEQKGRLGHYTAAVVNAWLRVRLHISRYVCSKAGHRVVRLRAGDLEVYCERCRGQFGFQMTLGLQVWPEPRLYSEAE